MTTPTLSMLDQAELMQLALRASGADDSGSAIGYLKEAASRADATAAAHYLLGAEYAQIAMYDRAIGEMENALALDPNLHVARLQLGMLWLGANQAGRAADTLGPLGELGERDPLRHFGVGLQHMTRDEMAETAACLTQGIALNHINPALNGDMQKIIDSIAALPAPDAAAAAPQAQADERDSRHILLSAYTGNETS